MGIENKTKNKNTAKLILIGILIGMGVLLFVGATIFSLVFIIGTDRINIESISMQPTLFPGDYVIVNKLAYRFRSSPQRGDIILFKYPPNPTAVSYFKRIIGLPGDQVHIAEGKVYIDGQLLAEPWLAGPTGRGGDWLVPDGQFFVLGDNRDNSSDSRSWGFVPRENIIGRLELIYLPPQHWAFLH